MKFLGILLFMVGLELLAIYIYIYKRKATKGCLKKAPEIRVGSMVVITK